MQTYSYTYTRTYAQTYKYKLRRHFNMFYFTVMLVNVLMVYNRPNPSLGLVIKLRGQPSGRSIDTIDIGRICLVIRSQNKAQASIWGVEMFYIEVSFEPQKINVECKLGSQSSYLEYVRFSLAQQANEYPRQMYKSTYV